MRRGLVTAAFSAFSVSMMAAPAVAAEPGPPLQTPAADLQAALSCPGFFADSREPVLLVHGTATDATKWDGSYADILPPHGFDVCAVELPSQAMDDIQVATEYVVHAIRWIANVSGQPVDVIGHSQGALEIRWAARWWPDVTGLMDDSISIAGSNHGTTLTDLLCQTPCAAAAWQQRPSSNFLAALNEGDETPDGPSWTSLWSQDDGAIAPPESSVLDGASNIRVQDLCAGRSVDHNRMILDAVVFELVLDALRNDGPADPSRFDAATCAEDLAPGADPPPDQVEGNIGTIEFFAIIATGAPLLLEEPPLADYVTEASDEPTADLPTAGPDPVSDEVATLPDTGGAVGVPIGLLLAICAAAATRPRRTVA